MNKEYTKLNIKGEIVAEKFELEEKLTAIADLAVDANGTAIAAAVNAIIAALVETGIIEEAE